MLTFIIIFVCTLLGAAFGYFVEHVFMWAALGFLFGGLVRIFIYGFRTAVKAVDELLS